MLECHDHMLNYRDFKLFPHVVNLCCKAVLGAITDLKFAEETAADYERSGDVPQTFEETLKRDLIANHSLINKRRMPKSFYSSALPKY